VISTSYSIGIFHSQKTLVVFSTSATEMELFQ